MDLLYELSSLKRKLIVQVLLTSIVFWSILLFVFAPLNTFLLPCFFLYAYFILTRCLKFLDIKEAIQYVKNLKTELLENAVISKKTYEQINFDILTNLCMDEEPTYNYSIIALSKDFKAKDYHFFIEIEMKMLIYYLKSFSKNTLFWNGRANLFKIYLKAHRMNSKCLK